jgi:hypothetical protein
MTSKSYGVVELLSFCSSFSLKLLTSINEEKYIELDSL